MNVKYNHPEYHDPVIPEEEDILDWYDTEYGRTEKYETLYPLFTEEELWIADQEYLQEIQQIIKKHGGIL